MLGAEDDSLFDNFDLFWKTVFMVAFGAKLTYKEIFILFITDYTEMCFAYFLSLDRLKASLVVKSWAFLASL